MERRAAERSASCKAAGNGETWPHPCPAANSLMGWCQRSSQPLEASVSFLINEKAELGQPFQKRVPGTLSFKMLLKKMVLWP